ncbi:MAG: hypothetical protein IKD44_08580 [Lentisphaeria bacterium]|nr:hypothetical protein [Lentisphaeria bacterium]
MKKCDSSKKKVGFEIPMTRYFCEYQKQESAASFTTTFLQGGEIVVKEVIQAQKTDFSVGYNQKWWWEMDPLNTF